MRAMRSGLFTGTLLLAYFANGHHSSIGIYDEEHLVEIEGVVTGVEWRNPHPSYEIAVIDESGRTVEWQIETGSTPMMAF